MSREADFAQEVQRSIPWLADQLWMPMAYTKVPDSPRGAEHRFVARKGYDAFLIAAGRHVALEYKLANKTNLPFDAVDGYQESKLVEAAAAGAGAFLLVNFRVTFSDRERKARGVERAILAFAIDIHDWLAWRCAACRASAALREFEARADVLAIPRIPWDQGIGWDLRRIVARVLKGRVAA